MRRFDALAIGGGPAGAAAAIRLARLGYSVAVVESRPAEFKIGESLPPSIKPLLADLGALDIVNDSLPSYGNQSAWGSSVLRDTDFIRDPNGCGWHVDRARFDASLRALASRAGASILERTRVERVHPSADGHWHVNLRAPSGMENCEARWVLDSSGRAASLARAQGAKRIAYDRLLAVAAVFTPTRSAPADSDSLTLVESARHGWWYTSLVPGSRRIVVFHTDAGSEASLLARTPAGFLSLLESTRHVRARIEDHGHSLADPLRIAAANTAALDCPTGQGWLAAGDAAVSLDPLSSQGILTALYSGIMAAEAVHECVEGKQDALGRYAGALEDVFRTYLRNREMYYRYETRWPQEPFWSARTLAIPLAARAAQSRVWEPTEPRPQGAD